MIKSRVIPADGEWQVIATDVNGNTVYEVFRDTEDCGREFSKEGMMYDLEEAMREAERLNGKEKICENEEKTNQS